MSEKRVAIVTGSNKGIGFSIVRALCKQFKGDVFLTSRDEGRGKKAVKDLEAEGLHPKFHILDITDPKSVAALKEYIQKEYNGVDVLVHNAAIAYKGADPAPFSEQARVTVATNFTSTINLCDSFLPLMRNEGRIAIVSSLAAKFSFNKCSKENQEIFRSPDMTIERLVEKINEFVESAQTNEHQAKGFSNSAYGMSKLGVSVYTRILAKKAQQNKTNVLVNCCCPGYVNTDMSSHRGTKTPDQGAETPVYIALLPEGSKEPTGQFFSDKTIVKWDE